MSYAQPTHNARSGNVDVVQVRDIISQGPFLIFDQWLQEAASTHGIKNPCAASLATISSDGLPKNRVITISHYDSDGFVFYTHKKSKKCEDMVRNPNASICFYWDNLDKQIRIEGRISTVREVVTDAYFATLSKNLQVDAWGAISSYDKEDPPQSEKIMEYHMRQFLLGGIPRPQEWSGFRLQPNFVEFWQRGKQRTHIKHCFELSSNKQWIMRG